MRYEEGVTANFKFARLCTGLAVFVAFRAFGVGGVSAPLITPGEGDAFDLYVGGDEQYDSNIYRLPNAGTFPTVSSPGASRADLVSTASLGADGQRALGRQLFDVSVHADENRFAHNGTLNNTSGYANLLWSWQVGPYFSGTAGATYARSLVGFGEALYIGRDLLDSSKFFGTARYQAGPHWALYGGISDSSIAHSAKVAQSGDYHTKAGNAGIEYAVDVTDTFGFEYRYDQGRFPPGNYAFSPDFHDNTLLFKVNHAFSDKTQLVADAGYQKRFYPNTVIGAFSGDIWRVALNWQATEKTQLAFAAWHELHAYLVAQTDYFVSKGGSIAPTWIATEKLSLSSVLSYEKQDYIAQSQSVVTLGPLSSKISTERVNINYAPRAQWMLGLSYSHQKRDSTKFAPSFQYTDDFATFSVLYKTR